MNSRPHAVRHSMKLLALIQALLLLTTSLVPEGRVLLSGGSCAGECGCSADSRRSGTCCCSTAPPSESSRDSSDADSCCQSGKSERVNSAPASCCSRKGAPKSCCSEDSSPRKQREPTPDWGMISTCGCGEYSATLVLHAPRTVVRGVRVQGTYARPESSLTIDECCNAERSAPATPPPKSSSC
ncbi:hypothetical protein Fuma_03845 [Fuerstiella marisgermanici]|uniref:Uncharacterized protein n=1 Tax=Fuerstiella marisgermanici TaxID=1891926 RepID=A0A1P8WJI7_9PLAN|nr:hypothetical protein Fuma_03845 [Fuerstiella marisgermanici]